jgi:hypothetical protein
VFSFAGARLSSRAGIYFYRLMARLEEVAEKLTLGNKVRPQRLKPNSKHALTAALEAPRHPKSMQH